MKKKTILIAVLTALIFLSCSDSKGKFKGLDLSSPVEGTIVDVFNIKSKLTFVSYPVHVYLPSGYGESDEIYPVIYSTDGQWVFPGQVRILEQLNIKAVLVSVEEGFKDRRMVDYLPPGAEQYLEFLKQELTPLIEKKYRVNPSDRTIVGVSAGGGFVGHALILDPENPPFFKNYFIFDGKHYWNFSGGEWEALTQDDHYYTDFFQERYDKNQTLDINVIITYAYAPEGNEKYSKWYYWELDNIGFEKLKLYIKGFKVKHVDVDPPSFWFACQQVF